MCLVVRELLYLKMVRINLVKPSLLSDEHLIAEFNEIQMLITINYRYLYKGVIPNNYVLGEGHITFFRDKWDFILDRLELLFNEMVKRKFNFDWDRYGQSLMNCVVCYKLSNWKPNKEDIELNKSRLKDRILNPLKKTNNFHYYGNKISKNELLEML